MYVGKTKAHVYAKCPYFHREEKKSLTCEGFQGSGTVLIRFDSEEEKNKYIIEQCYKYPNDCLNCYGCDLKYSRKENRSSAKKR